jgi:MFS family permease
MIQDFFRDDSGSSSVTVAVAGGFVGILSTANMAGRFAWSPTSDVVGRKPIYMLYLGGGMICYTLLALIGATSTAVFVLLAVVILSFYGGGFATVPAYLRDLFGTFQVGAIHGRLLTAWSVAGVAGPLIVNRFLDADGRGLSAGPADHGRGAGRRVPGQPGHPPGSRALPRTGGRGGPGDHRRGGEDLVMSTTTKARLVFGWALVGIPLAYGGYETLVKTASLFTG